ncbi:MAG: site-specific integrase [Coriobacteriia bacterium]|nr:site-specific integrase [Coriobacteriia bacterium]
MTSTNDDTKARRRPKGSGSLRHLDGDRWQVTVKALGQRTSRVFAARTATEAHRNADSIRVELLANLKNGTTAADAARDVRQSWTVEQYTQHYFAKWAPYHLAATTRQRYKTLADNQVAPFIGKRKMSEITPSDLSRLYATLGTPEARKRGTGTLAPLTIWHAHTFIEALFTFAVDVEHDFEKNPARDKSARPQVERAGRKPQAMDVAEVERFVASAREHSPAIYPAVMVSAYIGARRGEALALRWSDIDFKSGTVTLRRSIAQTTEDGIIVKGTKTGKHRTIPLDDDALQEIREHQKRQREQRVAFGKGWRGATTPAEDYVCANPDGSTPDPLVYSGSFRVLAKNHGGSHITPHVLRHAWVSQMIALGFDAVTIAAMSGHSPDVLLTTYAHAFDDRKRDAMTALGQARKQAREARIGA